MNALLSIFTALAFACHPLAAAEKATEGTIFDAAVGFKPAQRSFQPIFLQLAGSLEHYGTPANYLRHVNSEAKRVEEAWLKAKGKPAKFRPEYFTEEYIGKLITGWNQMERVLALDSFTRNSGRHMRYAILGTENVPPQELAAFERKLTKEESAEFQRLLAKSSFKKSDLKALEAFYTDGNGFDKLSPTAKVEVNKRVWRGAMDSQQLEEDLKNSKTGTIALAILGRHQEATVAWINGKAKAVTSDDLKAALTEGLMLNVDDVNVEKLPANARDAIVYSHAIKDAINSRLEQLRKQASPQQMKDVEAAMNLMMENLLVAARLEFETGIWEEYLTR